MEQSGDSLFSLCLELDKEGYHPVLPFGNSRSGKTSLLLSLLAGLHHEKIPYRLDLELLKKYPGPYADARNFFDYYLRQFIENIPPVGTRNEEPIYIPIIVTMPNTRKEIRLAFLECNGEWYQAVGWNKGGNNVAERAEIIQGVLKAFNKGITLIYVAAYMENSKNNVTPTLGESDTVLFEVLKEYSAFRRQHHDYDKHLFLLNKWDEFKSPYIIDQQNDFSNPNWNEIGEWLEANYRHAWPKFQSMAPIMRNAPLVMQYSAGRFDSQTGQLVDVREANILPIYTVMRRKIWDWLIQNADENVGSLFGEDRVAVEQNNRSFNWREFFPWTGKSK